MFREKLSPAEKISKAKFGLYQKFPMFSYLVSHLKIQEKNDMPMRTCAVDNRGNLFYDAKFVDGLTNSQLMGVLSHEVLHVALAHIPRGRQRNPKVWNIAMDIATNFILQVDGFDLPKEGILCNIEKDSVSTFGMTIENVSKKSVEDIYEEFKQQSAGGNEKGEEQQSAGGFDEHQDSGSGEKDSEKGSDTMPAKSEKDWAKVLAEAEAYAKQMGKESLGMKRELYEIRKSKINWRSIIRKVIASAIPFDLTFSRPHKAYLPFGLYMPSTYGEKVSVLVSIDTSGSIGQKELSDFMSEVVAIARSYPQVDFRILSHDVEVLDDFKLANGNITKLKSLELHGGGGTSHIPLYEYIKKNRCKQHAKLLLSFTDGYSQYPDRRPAINTLFILAGGHLPKDQMPSWGNSITIN